VANVKIAMEYAAKIEREALEDRLGKWVGLTDEEVWFYFENEWPTYISYYDVFKMILEWQEEKLRSRNGG
jgi:hypothetical protein